MPKPSTPSELAAQETPSGLSVSLQALWWLKKGKLAVGAEWNKAHKLCQQAEGDTAHDLVHALVHWIEGDMGNASYWYQRVGDGRAPDIAQEWERIAAKLIVWRKPSESLPS